MQNSAETQKKPTEPAGFPIQSLLDKLTGKDTVKEKVEHLIEQKDHVISEQQKRIKLLEEYLRLEKIRQYGPSSEKNPAQGEMFNEAEVIAEETVETGPPAKKKKGGGRKGLSDKLPRVQIYLKLSEEEKAGAISTYYSKIKEELDIIPAQARVLEYMQEKAVFAKDGNQHIKSAKQPKHPLGKAIASIQLLTWIIIAKYCDALPLYRQEKILKRYGGDITRATMANWIIRLAGVFQPLINLMREIQQEGDYLQMDETRLQVLKEPGRPATSDKWMWLVRGGPPGQTTVLFEYDVSRGEGVPLRLLDEFSGTLQVDGYAGYNKVCRGNDITRIGCWDHVRRKFVDAVKAIPAKSRGKSMADKAIGMIGELYKIEKKIKGLPAKERKKQRQHRSVPLLNNFKAWLDGNINKTPKDGLMYKAMGYAVNQWCTLTGYCEDGQLEISNILAENAIRPFAVGRRNWLFSDTPEGARASATCYSLIETARTNDLEPYAYIHYVLEHIAEADTVEKLEALLPWNVKGSVGEGDK